MRFFSLNDRAFLTAPRRSSPAANCATGKTAIALLAVLPLVAGCGGSLREDDVAHDGVHASTPRTFGTPDSDLRVALERLTADFRGTVGIYVRRLPDGPEVAIRADEVFPTASLVKVPILLKLLERVDAKEVSWTDHIAFEKSRIYPGEDLLARFADGQKVTVPELIFLMLSKSDNTASLWCQELAGGGVAINDWLDRKGFPKTRVNSKTPGREADRTAFGWGQTTPREMAGLFLSIRSRTAVSPGADMYADRALGRSYWADEALSAVPPDVHVISKQGAVNASRSEVLLVSAPSGPIVISIITKGQADQSWGAANEGFRLLRAVTAAVWRSFEPGRPYPAPIDGPTWP